ncbi:UbiD family decarboxylase [Candidatus Pantoea multigeneris]|uniref:Pyrrole-2-carboxylic acid decarboxylase n=1 Tax=Candidatus Pantoea multigeneris TaxID=2608357 RepID=A0ABX0RBI3_9GAMM|nr:UbiD family decarboxylase [Pantoea multigeneris]NIF22129.1 UbiD family decarboxylase [Pantoea multigeneris]
MSLRDSALDLRCFLQELKRRDDLTEVNVEVDADLEIAAICRQVYEKRLSAPLFNQIKDALPGSRVLGAPAGMLRDSAVEYSRLALHFGLPAETRPQQLVQTIRQAMKATPIKPRQVANGPVKQHRWLGDEVDLTRLPVPMLHQQDGGRYIGTYGFHVVQSPDGNWDSWSIGRLMLVDGKTLAGPTFPTQHIGMIREMWTQQGKATPWAFVLGAPPAAIAVAGMPLPAFVSEPDYIGALLGEPLEVVQAETNALWVPANAEIVIEGEISLEETVMEGPMGEYHGYQRDTGKLQPVFHVTAVTFRERPILPICVAGVPAEENHTIWGTMIAAQVLEDLQQAGLPVEMAWCSYEAASCWTVLAINTQKLAEMRTSAKALADQIAHAYFDSHAGYLVPKVIVVGDDIDITRIEEVVWALATRAHPQHDYFPYPDKPGFPLVPYLNAADLAAGKGGNMVINCLYPEQFEGKMRASTASFAHSYPDALQQQVLDRWQEYGFNR